MVWCAEWKRDEVDCEIGGSEMDGGGWTFGWEMVQQCISFNTSFALIQSKTTKRLMPMLLQRYKIYIAHGISTGSLSSLAKQKQLLLLLRIRTHLLAKSKVRHFQTSKGSDADKQDQKQRDDGSEAHEEAGCEVLVPLEEATLVAGRVCALVVS